MEIRPVTRADWPAIWPIFRHIVEEGETYAYPWPMSSAEAQREWCPPPPGLSVVAALDLQVVGTARMGPNRLGRGSHIATASFMVDPAARGQGVGRALAEYFIDWARRGEYRGAQFNAVVETNAAAIKLWRAFGFQIVGTVPAAFDHRSAGLVALHVMYRSLREGGE